MSSDSILVSGTEVGNRTVVMTTSQLQLLASGGAVATTTVIGPTPVPASITTATMQVAAAQALSLHAPIAAGHRSDGGMIHAQPLTAQVCEDFVEFIKFPLLAVLVRSFKCKHIKAK